MNPLNGFEVKAPARRVISGVGPNGASTIVADGVTVTRAVRPNGAVVEEIWRQESLPATVSMDGVRDEVVKGSPPASGASVKLYTVPPDHMMDMAAYEAAKESLYGAGNGASQSAIPGMHRTDTLDVVTVVRGEIFAVFETGEALLEVGDSVIVPGTFHAWSNRSDAPATIISTVFPLTR
ncbi:hypothetical protein AB0N24_26360 [Arthrobacter sp. NPDC093128]|uniref:hypothetical protein n=1 Tax=Arthrobacter sp. NPDC093128 TaxID=3154979 RepID=UPI00341E5FC1